MNKNRKTMGIMTFVVCLALLNVFLTLSLNNSYAIDPEVGSFNFPTNDFKPTLNSVDSINYVSLAYNSLLDYDKNSIKATYLDSFNVVINNYNNIPLYSLMKNAEMPDSSETFGFGESHPNPNNIYDKGILYILGHGYNVTNTDKSIFSNYDGELSDSSKQYVTQIALWLYIYESEFNDSFCLTPEQCIFYDNKNNTISPQEIEALIKDCASAENYQYLDYIIQLVDNAKKYGNDEISQISLPSTDNLKYNINDNSNILTTSMVTPSVVSNKNNFINFTVQLDNPNNYDIYLVDSNGTKLNNGAIVNSFRIVIQSDKGFDDIDFQSIKINVFAHFIDNDAAKSYRVTSTTKETIIPGKSELLRLNISKSEKIQRFSDVLFGYLPYKVIENSFTLHNPTE